MLADIEQLTRIYADAHDRLASRVAELQDDIEATKRRRLAGIKNAVRSASEARDQLHAAIAAQPELFERPRSLVLSGIRVGYQKAPGKLVFDAPDKVVALIRKHFPDQADVLIRQKEEPVRKALGQLSVADLKRIGVSVEETGDQIIIKPTDDAVDKLVSALLAEAEEDA
jgi:hypothetical protein